MRQQLIEWLIEDVAPRVRKSGKAEQELLKFASEKNLSPALLESLGQLFNTAKTLSFLEKSATAAERGSEFPIVDVQKLVSHYLEVPAKKMATDADAWIAADDQLKPWAKMPDFFSMPETSGLDFQVPKSASAKHDLNKVSAELQVLRKDAATMRQVQFDVGEHARTILDGFLKQARTTGIDFHLIEEDALSLHGDEIKPALDKIASYLTDHHIKVKRGSWDGKPRLVECDVDDIKELADDMVRLKEASAMIEEFNEQIKNASALIDLRGELPPKPEGRQEEARDPGSFASAKLDSGKSEPLIERGNAATSPFTTIPESFFEMLRGPRDKVLSQAGSVLGGESDTKVEDALDDASHLALLQDLMTTDDVLAEADPDAVVSAYNTIRATAPQLAKDINAMRVALRSAVQHEGIDPFTIKGIAETEMARSKASEPHKPFSGRQ